MKLWVVGGRLGYFWKMSEVAVPDSVHGDDFVSSTDGSSQDTLPDTQPVRGEHLEPDPRGKAGQTWAHLISRSKYFHSVSVRDSRFSVGKAGCDYNMTVRDIPKDCIDQYSRRHFVLEKLKSSRGGPGDSEDFDVFITDYSMNGTFVNGEIVGRGKRRPLVNFDVIAMTNESREAFQLFLSTSYEHGFENPHQCSFGATAEKVDKRLPPELYTKYIVGRRIGKGSCGCVYLGYTKHDGDFQRVAIKVVSRTAPHNNNYTHGSSVISERGWTVDVLDDVTREVDIMRRITGHPCIVGLKDVFSNVQVLAIVMEFAAGGELFDYVLDDFNKNTFDEKVAKLQFYQIVSAVKHLHERNVCHRDIKLENILMAGKSKRSLIKLSDFGLSKYLDGQAVMSTYVGTPSYIAPEVLKNASDSVNGRSSSYTVKADMWSLGCILYSLLCGSPAFHGANDVELKRNIRRGRMNAPTHRVWNVITDHAKDLLKKLLVVNPRMRLSAQDALRHPWFTSDPDIVAEAETLMGPLKKEGRTVSTISNEVGGLDLGEPPVCSSPRSSKRGHPDGAGSGSRAQKRKVVSPTSNT